MVIAALMLARGRELVAGSAPWQDIQDASRRTSANTAPPNRLGVFRCLGCEITHRDLMVNHFRRARVDPLGGNR